LVPTPPSCARFPRLQFTVGSTVSNDRLRLEGSPFACIGHMVWFHPFRAQEFPPLLEILTDLCFFCLMMGISRYAKRKNFLLALNCYVYNTQVGAIPFVDIGGDRFKRSQAFVFFLKLYSQLQQFRFPRLFFLNHRVSASFFPRIKVLGV